MIVEGELEIEATTTAIAKPKKLAPFGFVASVGLYSPTSLWVLSGSERSKDGGAACAWGRRTVGRSIECAGKLTRWTMRLCAQRRNK
jgi:hypothetical protein